MLSEKITILRENDTLKRENNELERKIIAMKDIWSYQIIFFLFCLSLLYIFIITELTWKRRSLYLLFYPFSPPHIATMASSLTKQSSKIKLWKVYSLSSASLSLFSNSLSIYGKTVRKASASHSSNQKFMLNQHRK